MATEDSKTKTPSSESVPGDGNLPVSAKPQTPTSATELSGWRLKVTIACAFVGFFLSLLDTTIVAVSLPTIADHFHEFDRSTWVINAYLITYMGFAIITSRLSDIFSRKTVEVSCYVLFLAFSIGCALSQSMTQLIIFRAFQGIGGSGLYSMCMVMCMTLIPFKKRGLIAAYTSICVVCAGVLGPILGGAITRSRVSNTWPWIFWINIPLSFTALVALLLSWPSDNSKKTRALAAVSKIDFLGALLLLAASVLLVFALEEAGSYQFAWGSAAIVATLTISGVCFFSFAGWQYWLAFRSSTPAKIIFPVNLLGRRVITGAIMAMLFSGFTYYIAVVNIPQRFQIVSGDSPIIAGVRLLPLMVSSAVGSLAGGTIGRGRNFTSYTLIAAGCFQVLGYGLMTTLGNTRAVTGRQYGFQVFLGLGFGLGIVSVTRMMELQTEPRWIAVTQGALAQMRSLGGSIGLAAAVIVLNAQVKGSEELSESLTQAQTTALLRSPLVIETFSREQQDEVAAVFATAFTQQMRVATYIAAASFVVSLLTWERHPPHESMAEKAMKAAMANEKASQVVIEDQSAERPVEDGIPDKKV